MVFTFDLNKCMSSQEEDNICITYTYEVDASQVETGIQVTNTMSNTTNLMSPDIYQNAEMGVFQGLEKDSNNFFMDGEGDGIWKPICSDVLKPYVNQIFSTIDEAFLFYKEYGRNGGFDVRRSTTKKYKDGTVYLKYFVCSSAGIYENVSSHINDMQDYLDTWESDKKKRRTTTKKCGCNAKIILKSVGLKGFMVSLFEEDHNHQLASQSGKQFLRCNREMTYDHMQFVFDAAKSNLGGQRAHNIYKSMIGSYSEVGPLATDFKNFSRDMKGHIGKHDSDMILRKFKERHETTDKNFMYEYELHYNGNLSRIFWVEPAGRRSYEVFGDVVSFDATYRTNRYGMVFVPFIGLDNHWKSVTFAAALLSNEDTHNFGWAFDMFIKVMGHPPKCIVTDQCPAMKAVIPIKFPGTTHRLCMWHIMQKFPAKLGTHFCAESPFMKKIKNFVWSDHASPEEFEIGWKSVIEEFDLQNNKWLTEMYNIRRFWIPAYFTNDPMTGLLRTTSRSESSNFYFSHFVQKGDSLVEFYMCYESAIQRQLHNNASLNRKDYYKPKLVTTRKIERDAAEQYTLAIFYKVQEEIKSACFDMELDSVSQEESAKIFLIKDPLVKNKLFQVHVDLISTNVNCSCKLYVRVGYLCRHAFFCLNLCGIHQISRQQLSNRWLKNAENRYATLSLGDMSDHSKKEQQIRSIRTDAWFEFQGCMNDAGSDIDALEFVLSVAKDARKRVKDMRSKNSVQLKKDVIEKIIGIKVADEVTVLPPLQSNNKGSRKRIVSAAEKSTDGRKRTKRKCKSCEKEAYHDSRTCPERKTESKRQKVE